MAQISGATMWRWLSADAIAPWRHRSWIFPRDPDFEVKAGRVLDLSAGRFEGRRLVRREYVVSANEKTSIQARVRCHPTLPPAAGRVMRVEHEYERGRGAPVPGRLGRPPRRKVVDLSRDLGVSEQTIYTWRQQGGSIAGSSRA